MTLQANIIEIIDTGECIIPYNKKYHSDCKQLRVHRAEATNQSESECEQKPQYQLQKQQKSRRIANKLQINSIRITKKNRNGNIKCQ